MQSLLKRSTARAFKPQCGGCGKEVAPDDINIADGTLLCRRCGQVTLIRDDSEDDDVAEAMRVWTPATTPVPRPRGARAHVLQRGDGLMLTRFAGSIGLAVFLTLFEIGWTAATGFLLLEVVRDRSVEMILFAVPFVVAWIAVLCLLIGGFTTRETLTIGLAGVGYEKRAIVRLSGQRVALDDLRDIAGFESPATDDTPSQRGLCIRTAGRSIRFAKGASDDELLWLADVIRRRAHELAPRAWQTEPTTGDAPPAGSTRAWAIELGPDAAEQPVGTTYRLEPRSDGVRLTRWLGHDFTFGGVVSMFLICAFCNGILSVFLWGLISGKAAEDMGNPGAWFMGLFLVPFVAIGLVLLVVLLGMLLQPFTVRTWWFGYDGIRTRFSVLGLGWSRTRPLDTVARMEFRGGSKRRRRRGRRRDDEEEEPKALALIDVDGEDIIEISPMTEGEARWVAAELYSALRHRFRRR